MKTLDLMILGTGPAASRVATRVAQQGWSVGVVDSRPIGGTCALRGCNPKKVFVRAAEAFDRVRCLSGKGVDANAVRINWPDLIRFKRTFTEPVTPSKVDSFEEAGIHVYRGTAGFTGPNELQMNGTMLTAKHVLIATGASPTELPIEGREHLTTSDEFMELERLPARIVFVGGGYVSFEFAHVAARAGAQVTILEMSDQALSQFEPELVQRLIERSGEIGITVRTGAKVNSIEKTPGDQFLVSILSGDKTDSIATDLVVHGAGRMPNVSGLHLEAAGIEADGRGIRVNEYLQSVSNPAIYAAGDVAATGTPPLSPVASQEGRTVATNLLEGNTTKADYGVVPTALFTVPALASVGLTQLAATEQGLSLDIEQGDWSKFNSMRKVGETHAAYNVLIEKESGRLLGAHLLGADAAETINLFAIAMKFGHTANDLKSVLMTFPTFAADLRSML